MSVKGHFARSAIAIKPVSDVIQARTANLRRCDVVVVRQIVHSFMNQKWKYSDEGGWPVSRRLMEKENCGKFRFERVNHLLTRSEFYSIRKGKSYTYGLTPDFAAELIAADDVSPMDRANFTKIDFIRPVA